MSLVLLATLVLLGGVVADDNSTSSAHEPNEDMGEPVVVERDEALEAARAVVRRFEADQRRRAECWVRMLRLVRAFTEAAAEIREIDRLFADDIGGVFRHLQPCEPDSPSPGLVEIQSAVDEAHDSLQQCLLPVGASTRGEAVYRAQLASAALAQWQYPSVGSGSAGEGTASSSVGNARTRSRSRSRPSRSRPSRGHGNGS